MHELEEHRFLSGLCDREREHTHGGVAAGFLSGLCDRELCGNGGMLFGAFLSGLCDREQTRAI